MKIEIVKTKWLEDDDDIDLNYIWLELNVNGKSLYVIIVNKDYNWEIGIGDEFGLKEGYYKIIDDSKKYYSQLIKMFEEIDERLGIDVNDYMSWDDERLIGFKVDIRS